MEVTKDTLNQLGAGDIPMIYVYNKSDRTETVYPKVVDNHVYISAAEGKGLDELIDLIKEQVYADNINCSLLIPYSEGNVVSFFMENATVLQQEYREDGVWLVVNCYKQDAEKFAKYV